MTKDETQYVKGISILLMYIHHLFRFPDRINENYILVGSVFNTSFEYILGDFGKLCVGIFLFISGYGLSFSKNTSFKNSLKRIKNMYFKFWFVFMIFVPVGFLFFNHQERYIWDFKLFLLNLLGLKTTYCGEWWFLGLYIELLLLFPMIMYILRKNVKLSIFLHLGLYILCFIILILKKLGIDLLESFNSILKTQLMSIMIWQLTFYIGILTGRYKLFDLLNNKLKKIKISQLSISIFILLLTILIRELLSYLFMKINIGTVTWIDSIISYFFIFSFMNICRFMTLKSKNILGILGKNSTNMWLIHGFFVYYFYQKLVFLPKFSILILLWLIILTLPISYLLDKIYIILDGKKQKINLRVKQR